MQSTTRNTTSKIRSRTSPNFGRVCASAVLQKTIEDLNYWRFQFLKIVKDADIEKVNAKLSNFLKKRNSSVSDEKANNVLDRAESYLTLYDELVKDAKSEHDKIVKRIGNKRSYNIPHDVKTMITRMDSSESEVLELKVDSKEDRANRQIIRCVVDGLATSTDALVDWSVKYTEKLKQTQNIISILDSVIKDATSYNVEDDDEYTNKILRITL